MNNNDVVITGMGVLTPIGANVETFWESNLQGRSGLRTDLRMDLSGLPCGWVAGYIPLEDRLAVQERWGNPDRSWGDTMLHSVLDQALTDAGMDTPLERPAGLVWSRVWPGASGSFPEDYASHFSRLATRHKDIGESKEALAAHFRSKPLPLEMIDQANFAGDVSQRLKTPLISTRLEATCAGGLRAVAEAARLLRTGKVDVAIVAVSVSRSNHYVLSQYAQLMALSRWKGEPEMASTPFDNRRTGMVINESAGALILETADHARRRGVKATHAVVNGWGLAVDTAHITAPSVDIVERVVRTALDESRMSPGDIDTINAHGTSTRLNDVTEAKALHRVFGERMDTIDVCAVKSLTGHGSAASGVIETVASALSLCRGVVPPVATCIDPDPECNVRTSLTPIHRPVGAVLKNSFGFGGQYASMVFTRPENPRTH